MQKKIAFAIVLVTLALTLAVMVYFMYFVHPQPDMPAPTDRPLKQEEGAEHNDAREAWIEQMHRTAPGANWRQMDRELRLQLAASRSEQYALGGTRADVWDTLAAGYAVGKWNEVGSFNTAGRVRATEIDFQTGTVYAFSQGGNLWKGDLEGDNWTVINDNFNVQSAIFLQKVGDELVLVTNEWAVQSVYRTPDEGLSWTACAGLENMTAWGSILEADMLNNEERTLYILVQEWDYVDWGAVTALYRSHDLGSTFEFVANWREDVYGNTENFSMWAPRYGDDRLYVNAGNLLYTVDGADGDTTYLAEIPVTTNGTHMLSGVQNTDGTSLYLATAQYGDGTQIYRSSDAGLSWTESGLVESGAFSRGSFHSSQLETGYLWFGGVNTFRSFNGGDTWTLVNEWWEYYGNEASKLHADIPFIMPFLDTISNEETLLISTDGGLYASDNYGLTNTNITMEGMRNAQYYDLYTYRLVTDVIFAGAQDQGFQRSFSSVDDQYYFDQLISGDYGHLVSSDGGDHLWTVYPGFAMMINDASGPANMYFGDFVGSGYLWLPPIMEDPDDPEVCWWGGGDHLYKLKKNFSGITYEQYDYDFDVGLGGTAIAAIAYSPIDHDHWYVMMSDGKFFHSDDRGITWTKTIGFDGPDSHYFYGSSIVPSTTELGKVYIGGSGYSNPPVWVSEDHGANFVSMSFGLPSTLVYDMAILPGDSMLFAATEVAPYVYIPETDTWYDLSGLDAPYQTYWAVEYVEEIKTVRFGTYGRGIFEWKLYEEEPPLSISGITSGSLQIFPNPAIDHIAVSIPDHIPNATITLYDRKGQAIWNTRAALNRNIPYYLSLPGLPTGMYFATVSGNNKTYTSKLIIN